MIDAALYLAFALIMAGAAGSYAAALPDQFRCREFGAAAGNAAIAAVASAISTSFILEALS